MPPRSARTPMPPAAARGALVAMFLLLAAAVTTGPGAVPALASCASGAPRASTSAFAGTVVALGRQGRVAQVRTDTGGAVEVRGTPAPPDPPGGMSATSVDRAYELGARYEFHPVNAASPFEDNICTATHLLPALPPAPARPAPSGAVPVGTIAAAVLVVAGASAVLLLRRRRSDAGDP